MDILICDVSDIELCRFRLPDGATVPATGDNLILMGSGGIGTGNTSHEVIGRTLIVYLPATQNGITKPQAYEWRLTIEGNPRGRYTDIDQDQNW